MRLGCLILTSFFLAFSSHAQSDLEFASHEYEFVGDSIKLKRIIAFLQSDSIKVLARKDQTCELKIVDLGTTNSMKFSVYHIEYGLGISCRGIFVTTFFKDDNFIGYYNSDSASPDKIEGDNLIWEFESGEPSIMDLSGKIPSEFQFGYFERRLIRN